MIYAMCLLCSTSVLSLARYLVFVFDYCVMSCLSLGRKFVCTMGLSCFNFLMSSSRFLFGFSGSVFGFRHLASFSCVVVNCLEKDSVAGHFS